MNLYSNIIFCGTADHQLYLYDIRAKKHPILVREWKESKIMTLKPETNGGKLIFILKFNLRNIN